MLNKKSLVLACLLASGSSFAAFVPQLPSQVMLSNTNPSKIISFQTNSEACTNNFQAPAIGTVLTRLMPGFPIALTLPHDGPFCILMYQNKEPIANIDGIITNGVVTINNTLKKDESAKINVVKPNTVDGKSDTVEDGSQTVEATKIMLE